MSGSQDLAVVRHRGRRVEVGTNREGMGGGVSEMNEDEITEVQDTVVEKNRRKID